MTLSLSFLVNRSLLLRRRCVSLDERRGFEATRSLSSEAELISRDTRRQADLDFAVENSPLLSCDLPGCCLQAQSRQTCALASTHAHRRKRGKGRRQSCKHAYLISDVCESICLNVTVASEDPLASLLLLTLQPGFPFCLTITCTSTRHTDRRRRKVCLCLRVCESVIPAAALPLLLLPRHRSLCCRRLIA